MYIFSSVDHYSNSCIYPMHLLPRSAEAS